MYRRWVFAIGWLLLMCGAAQAVSIAQAKSSPAMMRVSVDGVVTYIEPGECYVESTDRAGGVWVIAPTDGVSIGSG